MYALVQSVIYTLEFNVSCKSLFRIGGKHSNLNLHNNLQFHITNVTTQKKKEAKGKKWKSKPMV